MHYTTHTIIYTMHIAYYTDTTTIAGNEIARYHRFIDCVLPQCLCKLLLALAVYIVQCRLYNRNILHNVYYTLYNCIVHTAHRPCIKIYIFTIYMIYKAKQPTDVLGLKDNQITAFIPLIRLQLFKNFNP